MKNDLEGFVLFEGRRHGYDPTVGLIVTKTSIRLTGGAWRQCGSPFSVNVFFDDKQKRMMIKKADPKDANIYKCSNHGVIGSNAVRGYLKNLAGIAEEADKIRFEGHNPGVRDTVIFELDKGRKILE